MSDPTSPPPRAEQALVRLLKLAEGNGLAPDAIQLYSADDQMYDLEGTITLLPLFETGSNRYAGPPRGSGRKVVNGAAALKSEVERLRQVFQGKPSWITEAMAQLKEQVAGGWGLDDVRISLPSQSTILAATDICPACHGVKLMTCQQCHGQGGIVCPQCGGNRQELCHICMGSGRNPALPEQPCINCNGLRYAACRYCHGSGQLVCPTCHGQRGTACSSCSGTGCVTEEVAITCGARTHFKLKADGMPSGLRRGLDRLGIANLANGHADIEVLPPVEDEEDEPLPPPVAGEAKKEKAPKPEVHYIAHMPYADLRMNFSGKKVIVSIFGKKNVLLGVPPFLDTALEPARAALQKAARGDGSLEDALAVRVMHDALKLQVAGVKQVEALKRIYPQGLSSQVAAEILKNMRLALNRLTLRSRSSVAALGVVAGGGIFAGVFLTPLHARIMQSVSSFAAQAAIDFGFLVLVVAAAWFTLSAVTRLVLRSRFPDFKVPLKQKIGKTGYAMVGGLVVVFAMIILIAPSQPEWLHKLLTLHR